MAVERGRVTAGLYGLLLGVTMVALPRVFGPSTGWLIVWTVAAVQLAVAAWLVWRRTAFVMLAAAVLYGAGTSAVFAVMSARGMPFDLFVRSQPLVAIPIVSLAPILLLIARWYDPARWQRLKDASSQVRLRDFVRFRHIPDLRQPAS
jgi:hypothetical protein